MLLVLAKNMCSYCELWSSDKTMKPPNISTMLSIIALVMAVFWHKFGTRYVTASVTAAYQTPAAYTDVGNMHLLRAWDFVAINDVPITVSRGCTTTTYTHGLHLAKSCWALQFRDQDIAATDSSITSSSSMFCCCNQQRRVADISFPSTAPIIPAGV